VRYKEQQPEHECDNSRFTCFHNQTVSTPFVCCQGASVGFSCATQERIFIPPFGRSRRGSGSDLYLERGTTRNLARGTRESSERQLALLS
jgi:hypothetical protein